MLTTTTYPIGRPAGLWCMMLTTLCIIATSCDSATPLSPSGDQYDGKSQIQLDVDWSGYTKEKPDGMTVVCHHTVTGEKTQTTINTTTAYALPYLSPGRHWATVFNLTEENFANISFRGFESAATAEAYASRLKGPGWHPDPAEGDAYIAGQPEWLAVDTIMTAPVAAVSTRDTKAIGTLHPQNIIYTLHITIQTDNISNLRGVRAAISGMADGRKLTAAKPNSNAVTVTLLIGSDMWSRSRVPSGSDGGTAEAEIRCFGLPANHTGAPDENRLAFQMLLADGKSVMRYDLPVGHLIKETDGNTSDRRGDNLDLHLDLRLDPPLPPATGSGGMEIWLSDWDNDASFDIPI